MPTDRPFTALGDAPFERCSRCLFGSGRGVTFPCEDQGCDEFDRLSERARVSALSACAAAGFEPTAPVVLAID